MSLTLFLNFHSSVQQLKLQSTFSLNHRHELKQVSALDEEFKLLLHTANQAASISEHTPFIF